VELRSLLPPPESSAPLALGGAPAGDPYLIPSRMCALVLASAGYRAYDLGPDTPLTALAVAVERHRPALVWLALSVVADDAPSEAKLRPLVRAVTEAGGALVMGGRGALRVPADEHVFRGYTMAELAAYGAGLLGGR